MENRKERTYDLYKHNKGLAELEGVFASLVNIDSYMEWPKGTASNIYSRDYENGDFYSILFEAPRGEP